MIITDDTTFELSIHPDLKLAKNLGRQLAEDDCSGIEIAETIADAFPDLDLQAHALTACLLAQNAIRNRQAARLRKLQSWRDR